MSAGAFDQHGCPLIVFPADGQAKLSTQLSKNEVVDFINYFQHVHKYVGSYSYMSVYSPEGLRNVLMWTHCYASKKLEKECLVSLVADLRHASPPTVRFITETLLLLEVFDSLHALMLLVGSRYCICCLLTKVKFDVNADDQKTVKCTVGISIYHLF